MTHKKRRTKKATTRAGQIFKDFLDRTPSPSGEGPIGNGEFVESLGLNNSSTKRCIASSWIGEITIPIERLIQIGKTYPDFPLIEYIEASLSDAKKRDRILDAFALTMMVQKNYSEERRKLVDEYLFIPGMTATSDHPESLLDPRGPFENELLADRADDRQISKEEREDQVKKFQAAVSRAS